MRKGRLCESSFPWFGGKSRAALLIWKRFGNVPNYVELFAGSLAVLLQRPWGPGRNETLNDKDAWGANFWRALAADPDQVTFMLTDQPRKSMFMLATNGSSANQDLHAVCGYEGEYSFPSSWICVPWKANDGYANQGQDTRVRANVKRERTWFSPYCLRRNCFLSGRNRKVRDSDR